MFDSQSDDEAALEDMLVLLQADLENEQKQLRYRQSALVECARKYNEATQHVRWLKGDAKVVVITEYLSALNIRAQYQGNVAEALKDHETVLAVVAKLKQDILATEGALQDARRQVAYQPTNVSNVLEFPRAYSRRDPETDPE